jgi:hypothetical protein
VQLPDLRHLIAECPRHNAPGQSCGVYYSDERDKLRGGMLSGILFFLFG